jgi:hypothetical protein
MVRDYYIKFKHNVNFYIIKKLKYIIIYIKYLVQTCQVQKEKETNLQTLQILSC